ncbi:hypothetical protein AF335_30330 [Streptomyces eurocidicus]|uniref:Uncharacterized protein n=1 Tax=Streptomyces eurocidicus TaxID=66423 RepID=A0A2N8NMT8_STREU|nr:hypothetical protein [Streptomyces eurocidicus]MBB5118291.1 hypothetical protein [Streptomyces eurocidicus]MBF6054666.1 hypothetical protein [Streptomyces eurocidicus]PNE30082.1 hypothetical protein AF335_30330 [Streptomyces eurocidicus]
MPRPPRPRGLPARLLSRLNRQFFAAVTLACLLTALGICVWWVTVADEANGHFEPATSGLALVAAVTGVYAERRAAARERRTQALHALADELVKNTELLGTGFAPLDPQAPRARVHPRLVQSATDAALVSGVFSEPGHEELVTLLHRWRDGVHDFNQRLDLVEVRTYISEVPITDLLDIDESMQRPGGRLDGLRQLRAGLEELLRERYAEQPGVAARLDRLG